MSETAEDAQSFYRKETVTPFPPTGASRSNLASARKADVASSVPELRVSWMTVKPFFSSSP
jgi:hypothetical protein